MSQLTFPILSDELTLPVLIGHNRKALAVLLAAGGALPSPVSTKAVVDTGTNVTCVDPAVLQRLGLLSTSQGTSQTAAGQAAVKLFEVSLSITPPANSAGPMLTRRDLIVMELPCPIPGVDVLVGMDILLDCRLLVDGPARQFSLEF